MGDLCMGLKLLGCVLVIGASTMMGYLVAEKYSKRPAELRTLQAALQMLELEIAFSVNALPEAFERIAQSLPENIGMLFAHASELLKERTGIPAKKAWRLALKKAYDHLHLEKQDREILITFGNSLGCSDKDNQIKNIHLACSKLAMEEKKAEVLRQKNEKMYKSLGVLAGILIALLFV